MYPRLYKYYRGHANKLDGIGVGRIWELRFQFLSINFESFKKKINRRKKKYFQCILQCCTNWGHYKYTNEYHKSTETCKNKSQMVGDRPDGYLQSAEKLNLGPPSQWN